MKKIVMLLVSVVFIATIEAKEKKEPVIMTIAGKEIPLSEFIYMAKKDSSVDFNDKNALNNFVELFKDYKLKVADAESINLHKHPKFLEELENYKRQLQESYLQDKPSQETALRKIYDRSKVIPGFKHILFRFPVGEIYSGVSGIFPKDTVDAYNKAMDAYNRVMSGESFESVGESLMEKGEVSYVTVQHISPLELTKSMEDKVFTMKPGEISLPVRSPVGFHVVKLDRMLPNPGKVRVAHILTMFPDIKPTDEEKAEVLRVSDSIYQRAIAGDDFFELAKKHSNDTISGKDGGVLPLFGIGQMIESFEKAAFGLENTGDICKPIETRYGYHVIKLLEPKHEIPYEEMAGRYYESMRKSDRNFELYEDFIERMKVRHGYKFYPEAYEELERLADEYFPLDTSFYYRGMEMEKTLVVFDSASYEQNLFVNYIGMRQNSVKTLSIDFMNELFQLFLREILTEMEREIIERDFPEFNMQINEYHDGFLLFEISNRRVWRFPSEDQDNLEKEWVKELNKKYPVVVDKKVLKKIKKYVN